MQVSIIRTSPDEQVQFFTSSDDGDNLTPELGSVDIQVSSVLYLAQYKSKPKGEEWRGENSTTTNGTGQEIDAWQGERPRADGTRQSKMCGGPALDCTDRRALV